MDERLDWSAIIIGIVVLALIYSICKKIIDIKRSKHWVVDPNGAARGEYLHDVRSRWRNRIKGLEANGRIQRYIPKNQR